MLHILYTRSVMHLEQKRRLKPWNITPEQFNILRILRGSYGKPLALNDLTCRMIDPASNASRLVEKLRTKGMVNRTTCRKDRRRIDVSLTPEGMRCVEAATLELKGMEDAFEQAIPLELAEAMNAALDAYHVQRLEEENQ